MYKKTLLSLAIASSLSLTGCLDTQDPDDPKDQENAGSITNAPSPEQQEEFEAVRNSTYPVFSPGASDLPIPNDLIFDKTASDGTFAVPDSAPPVTTAINQLSGASTTAPIDIKLSDFIDPDSIKGRITDGPLQNVFLIELAYASGNTIQALSAGEVPTPVPPTSVDYEATHIELDGTSYIRINPIVPLKPDTRYVVVVTDGITDDEGNPITQDPGLADYAALTDADRGLADPALQPVRDLINRLWEPVALGYFNAPNSTNAQRTASELETLTASNIALSYSFTTSGDEKVLNYIADPAQWFADQITRFVGISTANAVVAAQSDVATINSEGEVVAGADGKVTYADFKLSIDAAIAAFPGNAADPTDTTIADALAPIEAGFAAVGCSGVTAGANYINCVGAVLANVPSSAGGFADLLPTPAATSVTFDDTQTLDIYQVSSLPASLMQAASVPTGTVSVTQGTLTIPYYLGQPAGSNGAPLITDAWEADDTLAAAINQAFAPLGLQIPQADPTVTTAVNYIFPFPKSTGDVTIPILAVHPTNPTGDMSTVMWQHGITTDRSTALTFGGSIVAGAKARGADVAVIAIDQPLHGIDGYSDADRAALAERLLVSASAISDDDVADGASDDAAAQFAIDGVVAGTYAEAVVVTTLSDNSLIDLTDGINASEQALIDSAFTSELTDNVVIGGLTQAGAVDPSDGLDATELGFVQAVYDGTFAETFVTGQLNAASVIDITDGIDAIEQGTIDAVLAGATGNPALAALEAGAASLIALQGAAQALPALESGAQSLALLQRTVLFGSSQIPGLGAGSDSERHFGFTANPTTGAAPLEMDYEGTALANRSGSMFINFTNFLTSRDNLRQQVLDLLALRKSIGSIDLNPSDDDGADLDANDVYFIGHSLGTINGIPFVAVANDSSTSSDNIVAANFLTPGGGISRFFENSPVFAPAVVDGLAAQGLTPDTSSYQTFINTLQAALDSIDPINFVGDFKDTTPVLFTEAIGDVFIPNSVATQDDVLNEGSISYLAGTEPLATISGATTLSESGALTQNIVRFFDATHETPVFPLSGTSEESAAYAEMVSQATSMILTGGTAISVTTTDGIVQ